MEPLSAIAAAATIAQATGISKWLGSKLGGKTGEQVAEKVIDIAAEVTGEHSVEKILTKLDAVPELRLRLQTSIMDNALELERLVYGDLSNARELQKSALAQDDLFSKRFVYYLASFWSVAAAIYIYMITFRTIPTDNVRFADTCLGFILGTLVASIIAYFFGSTRGSDHKNLTIAELAKKVSEK